VTGLVLAGGTGRRLGQPKAGVMCAGMSLLDRAVRALRSAGCELVVAVTDGDDGPLAALAGALGSVPDGDVIVLACDLPLAGPVVDRLAALPAGACAMAVGQPLCSRWPAAELTAAASALIDSGERRMMALADRLRPEAMAVSGDELLNVNTQADLARAALLLEN
jgi:molybdopterin-guanine dinucleotide biosynthesis protein A